LIGNGVATIVVGKWGNDVDMVRLNKCLNNETMEEAEQPEVVLDKASSHIAAS
jgi:aerobic C4-dicarboxylate transport protein